MGLALLMECGEGCGGGKRVVLEGRVGGGAVWLFGVEGDARIGEVEEILICSETRLENRSENSLGSLVQHLCH